MFDEFEPMIIIHFQIWLNRLVPFEKKGKMTMRKKAMELDIGA